MLYNFDTGIIKQTTRKMTAHVGPNMPKVTKHKEEEKLAGPKSVVGPINWSLIHRRNKQTGSSGKN
jgi:hypothetical protein